MKDWIKQHIPNTWLSTYRQTFGTRTVAMDIVGSCQLACPSCPTGRQQTNPSGRMSTALFHRLVDKIALDYPQTTVALYNWTEPLLHPELPRFIEYLHRKDLRCRLSSHFNYVPDPLRLAKADPDELTISLSGFTQPIYERTHKDGDIEKVKHNMERWSKVVRSTKTTVYYHKYKHNLDEVDRMEQFAEKLGFHFGAGWAYYMPIEKVQEYQDGTLPIDEVRWIDKHLALNMRQTLDIVSDWKHVPCAFPDTLLTLDCQGRLQVCCAVYDASRFTVGSYLDMTKQQVTQRLTTQPYCGTCTQRGLHIYASWQSSPACATLNSLATLRNES